LGPFYSKRFRSIAKIEQAAHRAAHAPVRQMMRMSECLPPPV
jgi:hypothetical protein